MPPTTPSDEETNPACQHAPDRGIVGGGTNPHEGERAGGQSGNRTEKHVGILSGVYRQRGRWRDLLRRRPRLVQQGADVQERSGGGATAAEQASRPDPK